MIDEIYIAPQKRNGSDEFGFYKVPRTSRGSFQHQADSRFWLEY